MEDFKAAIYHGQLTDALSNMLTKPLPSFNNTLLNIAVAGEPGSGKSSFVNAMLGLQPGDPGAAETGIGATTLEAKPYRHPLLPQVTLWDLPGKGGSPFGEDPFAKVDLNRFDFFIVVGFQRFRTTHADLVHEIQSLGKRFYFVRTKADLDLEASKRQQPSAYNEEEILQHIKEDCNRGLRREGVTDPQVFIVSTWETNRFDFPLLQERLKEDLLRLKRQAFISNLPNICLPVLEQKKASMKKRIWAKALWLGVIAALPVPGLSFFPALYLCMKFHTWCYHNFGLDDPSLANLAKLVGKTAMALKAATKPLTTASVALWRLTDLVGASVMIVEYFHWHHFPIIGCMVSGGISFLSSSFLLRKCISAVAGDTHRVLIEAVKGEGKKSI
nr:interferon-inducible GTPase 5-like [Pogona vitticeps]